MTSRRLSVPLALLCLSLLLAACQQEETPAIAATAQPEVVGHQLDLFRTGFDPSGLSAQAAAVEREALQSILGSGAKDGPLAPVGTQLARLHLQQRALRSGDLGSQDAAALPDVVTVDAVARGDAAALLADLEALGLRNGSVFGRMVSGRLPVAAIGDAARLDGLVQMRPAGAVMEVGRVTSEADIAIRTDFVREKLGYDGSGVRVGILSDSFARVNVDCAPDPAQGIVVPGGPNLVATYADDVASGDLPADVLLLDDSVACDDPGDLIDEGRAMGQLVYDLAPGSDLAFHTAFGGQADFAGGIVELARAGSGVIVDDVIYFAEPMFQDGIIAQAADFVAAALDVPYFSSAGNRSNRSYEAPFRDSGVTFAGGVLHDWDPGPGVQLCQLFTLQPGQTAIPVLQWDEPFASASAASPGSSSDLDLYLTFDDCSPIPGFASLDDNLGGDPVEITGIGLGGSDPATFGIAISLFAGPEPGLIKHVNFGSAAVAFDPPLDAPTSYGHNNALHARGVAAAFYADNQRFGAPRALESFSSFGGIPTLFTVDGERLPAPVVRQQPDFTAPDGTNTTFFFSDTVRDDDDGDGEFVTREPGEFPNFFGTSAAAPHAAAVAALLRQADPDLSYQEIYTQLETTADNIGPKRVDFEAGWGLIDAYQALRRMGGNRR